MKAHSFSVLVALCLGSAAAQAATVSAPSTQWVPLAGNYDFIADQQTGQPQSDIVGNGTNHGFFTTFNNNGSASATDGTLGFRFRLDEAGGNTNNPAFTRVAWIGIDANQDAALDVFVGLGVQGQDTVIRIYDAGSGANTGPSTTTIASSHYNSVNADSTNYNYRPVNSGSGTGQDGGTTNDLTPGGTDTDYYVSFFVNFQTLVTFLQTQGISITDQSALRYVMATSTQWNSLNQDLGGVDGGLSSPLTWGEIGGFSPLVTANGSPVPEPASAALAFLGLGALALRRRRK